MKDTWDAPSSNPWTITETRELHTNGFFSVETNDVIGPDGSKGAYQVVRMKKQGVGILPIEADGTVHLIGQWRFPLGRSSWEMAMGGAEAGEELLKAAARELSEETGLHAARWTKLIELDLSTSLTDEKGGAFLATDLSPGKAHPESNEVIRHHRAPFMDVLERAQGGLIREAMTVAAIFSAYHLAASGALPEALSAAMLQKTG